VPTRANDPAFLRMMARLERMAMSPGTAGKLFRLLSEMDVRHVLPAIRVPTLVLHRDGDRPVRAHHGRYLGTHIPGAKYVELSGEDHIPYLGDQDALLAEVREFLTGERAADDPDRVLATILFGDIVDSTYGRRSWRSGSACERASTPASAKCSATSTAASRSISARASPAWPSPIRCW
jgi:hypothetical protein